MLKNILKLDGAQQLSKNEQKEINGGAPVWCGYCQCPENVKVFACGNGPSVCVNACITGSGI